MTTWSSIITESAMLEIDDIRLQQQMETSPALFLRKMSLYVKQALPLINRPLELLRYLKSGMIEPTYGEYEWESTYESTYQQTSVSTQMIGFDVCSVTVYTNDGTAMVRYDDASYNSTTGVVTMPVQTDSGIKYSFDFYKDGEFPDMSYSVKRLFGLAISIVWHERFTNNWLNMQPKIKDSAFEVVNESNYMDKLTARMIAQRQAFSDELRHYETENAYQLLVHDDKTFV